MFNKNKRGGRGRRPRYDADVAAKTHRLGLRLEAELLARLDALAARLAAETPGVRFTRSDAARWLLLRALEGLSEEPRPRKKR